MKLASIQAAENKLLLNTYERNPYLFVSGQGVYLRDENGHQGELWHELVHRHIAGGHRNREGGAAPWYQAEGPHPGHLGDEFLPSCRMLSPA